MRAQELLVVAHVLEHLDRHDAIEARCVSKSFMSQVITFTFASRESGSGLDVSALRERVRDRGDRCPGWRSAIHSVSEPQPQPSSRTRWPSRAPRAERSGPASLLGGARSVGARHHSPLEYLRPRPRRARRRRRHLVVLLVGRAVCTATGLGAGSRRRRAALADLHVAAALRRAGAGPAAAGSPGSAERRERGRTRSGSGTTRGGLLRGNQGTKALVVRW
jgi:hypothetical protein